MDNLGFYGVQDAWKFVSSGGALTDLTMEEGDELAICFGGADPSNPGRDPFPRTNIEEGPSCAEIGNATYKVCDFCERPVCHKHILCGFFRRLDCKFGISLVICGMILSTADTAFFAMTRSRIWWCKAGDVSAFWKDCHLKSRKCN